MSVAICDGDSVQLLEVYGESPAYAWRQPFVGKTGQVCIVAGSTAQVSIGFRLILWPVSRLAPTKEEQPK